MRMNHPDGKRLLATVRDGDYAHAGEEEAIHLLWERLPKIPHQSCLDAGCGRGGTAAFVQSHGWATVTGIDIDAESIAEASARHPGIPFHAFDIAQAGVRFPETFDIIYAFNAFYAFPDQSTALRSLAEAARPQAELCLFDYVNRGGFFDDPFARFPESVLWQPINLDVFPAQLEASGWKMTGRLLLHDAYRRWYENLCGRFTARQETLRAEFSADLVEYAIGYYRAMLTAIENGALGGAIVFAERVA
jgi:Methylase involved in ubiquinone/menaquinone biosynthesis